MEKECKALRIETKLNHIYDSIGDPKTVATELDEIMFDWVQHSEEPLTDRRKNLLFTLKQLRNLFNDLQTIQND